MHTPSKQSGAILIIALLLLLVLTAITLTAARISITQQRISGNNLQQYTAFQAAESAITRAENLLTELAPPAPTSTYPSFDATTCGDTIIPMKMEQVLGVWETDWDWDTGTNAITSTFVRGNWMSATLGLEPSSNYRKDYSQSYVNAADNNVNKINSVGAYQPEFIIAFDCFDSISTQAADDERNREGSTPKDNRISLFRIIARGRGADSNAEVFLESIYAISN